MLNSKALAKIQSIILIAVIVVATVGGGVAYILLSEPEQSSETIKIGVLADLDASNGKGTYQGVFLAAEQINAQGGLLGRQIEVIGEDDDSLSGGDMAKISLALTRLLSYHKVDFIIGMAAGEAGFVCQDIIAEHKKIFLAVSGGSDPMTQRVLDDYENYKYYFVNAFNSTSTFQGMTDGLLLCREITGFNKVGYLGEDLGWNKDTREGLDVVLPEVYGFDLVYKGTYPIGTTDFSSYFAAAEAAGVEVLVPLIALDGGIPFVKEYYDRQSPMFVYGGVVLSASAPGSWEWTGGKCNHMAFGESPVVAGYPLTSKTLPTRDAYIDRWGEDPNWIGARGYDVLRFILSDAIDRAGTIETDAVIEALEETSIETTSAKNFVFTPSHGVMMGENPNDPEADYSLVIYFQWQNGELVPVYPQKIMEEAGATYTYPDWAGPWDD